MLRSFCCPVRGIVLTGSSFEVYEIPSCQANWQIGSKQIGISSLGGTYKTLIGSKNGTCTVPYWEHILHFGRFNNCQSANLPVCQGVWNFANLDWLLPEAR